MADDQQAQGWLSGVHATLEQMQSYQRSLEQQQVAQQVAQQQAQEQQARAEQEVADTFGAVVEAAAIVAMADGSFSDAESQRLVARVAPLTGGRLSAEQIEAMAKEAAARVQSEGASARADAVAAALADDELRRAALLVACAVGWTEGGIGQKEGLALQSLSRAFGIAIADMQKLLAQAHAGGGVA